MSTQKTSNTELSALEFAALAGAGFVIWKNRNQFQRLMSTLGVDMSSFIPAQYRGLAKMGTRLLNAKFENEPQNETRN